MRKQLENLKEHCIIVMTSPLAWLISAFIIGTSLSLLLFEIRNIMLWKHLVILPEPEQCALCTDNGTIRTYPCLVRLETGEIGQLRVYDIGREYLEEIDQFRETGAYSCGYLLPGCFASVETTAECSTATIPLPEDALYINPYLYCRDCRAIIGAVIKEERIYLDSYVLADLYDLENIHVYPIEDGAEYTIRGYTVTAAKEKKALTVTVTGYFS